MAVRRESIILELEDNASAEALRAAAAFKTLDTAIESIDGHATIVSRRFTSMTKRADGLQKAMAKANTALGNTNTNLDVLGSRGLVRFSNETDNASKSIDRYSGRLGLLTSAVVALGPALLPIGAAAVPAIASLATGMGVAAGAAGVLTLAFKGVGDAVTAVSDYRLEPTAENLAKVREEMERMGPEGAQFVMAIDRAIPALQDLQKTARAGIFPGWERGLNELMTQLPGVRNLVADLSATVGMLGEASANALVNDSDWQEFFDRIGTDGASALEDFGRATGNFTAGVANVLEALTGIGGGTDGLVEASRAFREWADNLEHTEGFQEFADYVRESGPQVADFLAATGKAMVGLAEAAAPWGQVVLPALTALAEVAGVIAGSPLGPPLFAAAAAMLAFNKASALLGPNIERAKASMMGLGTSLRQTGLDLGQIKNNMTSFGKQAAGAGAGIAAFGFMASGAADKMGLSNTALLTMAGAMAGPWGAAAGAAIGLAIDFAKANDEVEKSVTDAASAVASADFTEIGSQFKTANESLKEFKKDVESFNDGDLDWDFGAYMKGAKNWVEGVFGESDLEELQKKMADTRQEFTDLVDAGVVLGREFDIDVGGTQSQKLASLQRLAESAGPAMSALGITFEDLGNAAARGDGSLQVMVGRISEWQSAADSTAGRTDAIADAIRNLGEDAISTADSASALSAALQALIAPEQNLIATQDALTTAIRHLGDDLDKQNKTLQGNSDAAIKNRAAISDRVTAIQQMIQAEAEAGRGPEVVARSLAKQREALIQSAQAAGLNKRQVEALINQMNLTPDLVKTVFESAGIDQNEQKARDLYDAYARLPRDVRTDVKANGIPKSEADISRLQKKYNLTPAQVRTLASLKDAASGPIASILRQLINLDGKTATTTVTNRIITENIIRTRNEQVTGRADSMGHADGGEVMGQRYPYGDKVLSWLAPGEEVISNRHGQADRFRRDRAMGLIPAYADGGTIGIPGYATGGKVRRTDLVAAALWQSGHTIPRASLIAGMTERQLVRLGNAFDDLSVKRLGRLARSIERAITMKEKERDQVKETLDLWNSRRNELKSQVSSSLKRDWFGGTTGNVWSDSTMGGGTAAFAQQQWKKQAADANLLARTIANLRKNGAGDAFIAEILRSEDPLAAAQMFNKQSVAGMKHSQSLFLSATRATSSAANSTSSIYADEQRKATAELRSLNNRLKDLEKQLDRNHREAEATRKNESPRKAAGKGARDKR